MVPDFSGLSDAEVLEFGRQQGLTLTVEELRHIPEVLKRVPTLTELHIFNIEWSEHCSYKSSRRLLKRLPTKASNVVIGPGEDAGVVRLGTHDGTEYGLVLAHESHNHPSQIVPFEGAATGVGGIIRDVVCMGARVIGTLDALRFGDPWGQYKEKVRYITSEVVEGIAGYGNPLGIPNLGGDVYFSPSFDENCLVNVACVGVVELDKVIHSAAPAAGYDLVLVGKATDNSGFGGAAFASGVLDNEDANRGAVQVPDPFLKNVLLRATYQVFEEVADRKVGFKDLGAGGIMCATSELVHASGLGAVIDLDKVHIAMDLPPYMIACAETQERFCWVVPKEFTSRVLEIYNKEFELENVAAGACARVIGEVTADTSFVMRHKGTEVCNAPVGVVCDPVLAEREIGSAKERSYDEQPRIEVNEYVEKLVVHPQVASKARIFKHYDTVVLGQTMVAAGLGDAGVVRPIHGSDISVAFSLDGNPWLCRLDAREGGKRAVAEAVRNLVAVGASPCALTDCLNAGNPERPDHFFEFTEMVEGLRECATEIGQFSGEVLPFVSGNVSFYNQSSSGRSVDPSPIVMGVGIVERVCTPWLKKAGSALVLVGNSLPGLGGSVFAQIERVELPVAKVDCTEVKKDCMNVFEEIQRGVEACHDVSDGGLLAAVLEMAFGDPRTMKGFVLELDTEDVETTLLSESGGFVIEVTEKRAVELVKKGGKIIGRVTEEPVGHIINQGKECMKKELGGLKKRWAAALSEVWE